MRLYYPHGVVVEQAQRGNYYRGENQIYPESLPTLQRSLKRFSDIKEKELYRLVADMRIAEFKFFLEKFQHVREWKISDVLYDTIAQHYGLETSWLDITSDFKVREKVNCGHSIVERDCFNLLCTMITKSVPDF